jgi:hypothetical protein
MYLHATNPLQGHKTHQDIDIVQCHNINYKYKRSKAKHYKIQQDTNIKTQKSFSLLSSPSMFYSVSDCVQYYL